MMLVSPRLATYLFIYLYHNNVNDFTLTIWGACSFSGQLFRFDVLLLSKWVELLVKYFSSKLDKCWMKLVFVLVWRFKYSIKLVRFIKFVCWDKSRIWWLKSSKGFILFEEGVAPRFIVHATCWDVTWASIGPFKYSRFCSTLNFLQLAWMSNLQDVQNKGNVSYSIATKNA